MYLVLLMYDKIKKKKRGGRSGGNKRYVSTAYFPLAEGE